MPDSALPPLLEGLTVVADRDAPLPIRVCAERLVWLGASRAMPADPRQTGTLALQSGAGAAAQDKTITCAIGWQRPGDSTPTPESGEAIIQAISGLMAVHGRDWRVPRRIGLDVTSVAAGIIATQGILAALIGQCRGLGKQRIETSMLQASLVFLCHHLGMATCEDSFEFSSTGALTGPPFQTADGNLVEIEVLTFEAWLAFWRQLGLEPSGLDDAWSAFALRYLSASCELPAALHEATRRHTLAELRHTADTCGAAVCRARSYAEVLAEPLPGAPWTISPDAAQPGQERSRPSPVDAPLSGLRVVEITSRLQGPLASLLLAKLGAEVIKVEPPGGDFGRNAPPLAGAAGSAYLAYNRGKQVVEIDYKQPKGQAQLAELIAGADIFLHNWRSGRAEKLGLDFERLSRLNPGLVYAHASGWGQTGDEPSPFAGDFLVQAYAGCGDGLTPSGEAPQPSRLTLVDVTGGLLACEGILAGLYLRERSAQGCRVDTSLLAGAMTLQAPVLKAIADGHEAGRHLGRPIWAILDRPLETAEGFLVVSLEDEQAHRRLADVCGLDSANGTREERIVARLKDRPAREWERRCHEAGIAAAAVCSDLTDLPRDPRVAGFLERVNDACWFPAAPWRLL